MQTELLEKARQGDEKAIDDLIITYKSLVKSTVRKYFLVGSDMDDLMQEGMVGLYKAILSYRIDAGRSFESFAKLCVSRQVINAIKIANRQKNYALNTSIFLGGQGEIDNGDYDDDDENMIVVALEEENPESVALKKEQLKKFYDDINTLLTDDDKDILELYLDGRSYTEIAKEMNCTAKNVDNALTRIKNKLREN